MGNPGGNASAVAVCLECARLIREHNIGSVMVVFFKREEDGILGSGEFVAHLARRSDWNIKEALIFEMVGYRDRTPGSQTMRRARDLLLKQARSFGYSPFLQGSFDNVVLTSGDLRVGPSLLLGAH